MSRGPPPESEPKLLAAFESVQLPSTTSGTENAAPLRCRIRNEDRNGPRNPLAKADTEQETGSFNCPHCVLSRVAPNLSPERLARGRQVKGRRKARAKSGKRPYPPAAAPTGCESGKAIQALEESSWPADVGGGPAKNRARRWAAASRRVWRFGSSTDRPNNYLAWRRTEPHHSSRTSCPRHRRRRRCCRPGFGWPHHLGPLAEGDVKGRAKGLAGRLGSLPPLLAPPWAACGELGHVEIARQRTEY